MTAPAHAPRRTGARLAHRLGLAAAALVLAGCSAEEGAQPDASPGAAFADLGHIHALGVNPADEVLYVASHSGVLRLTASGLERVADRWQDTMAFAVAGHDHFLASGHPDLREDLPVHLGLVESTDAAQSWTELSLGGEADFHALDIGDGTIYGMDSLTGRLMASDDGRRWRSLGAHTVADVAADPSARRLLATQPDGRLLRIGERGATTVVETAPPLLFADWPEPDLLVGVGPDGSVHRSRDAGRTWDAVTALGDPPQAVEVTTEAWYAATASAIVVSRDSGDTWTVLVGDGGASAGR